MARQKRARTERRKLEREVGKLAEAREKLARLGEGGSRERAIEVESASVIEVRALSQGCARCEGELRLEEHLAVEGLRLVRGRCKQCGSLREIWLRVRLLS